MQDIQIPDIGDVDSVEVIELCVAVGDEVGPDDPLIVIESDKASMEVPAGASGKIAELTVAVGDEVSQGDVVARLEGAADAAGSAAEAVAEPESAPESEPESKSAAEEAPAAKETPTSTTEGSSGGSFDISVPDIGDVDEVVVIEVLVQPGATIAAGDLLVVLESDKASMEVPAEQAGEVTAVHVSENDTVSEGSKLVTIEVAAATSTADTAQPAALEQPAEAEAPRREADTPVSTTQLSAHDSEPTEPGSTAEVYAGPAARRLARELGVDLRQVKGSGEKGRILKEDLKSHVKKRLSEPAGSPSTAGSGIPPIPTVDFSKFGNIELQPLGRTRAVGAQNLHRSWLNIPHVTNHDLADITELEDFRKSMKPEAERRGIKVTPLAFIIKACTTVLREFPTFNASLDAQAENYILKHYCNIGMAVDTPNGLVVPVIANADEKGIWQLSEDIIALADKARERKLKPVEMQGGTFSVSSLGNIGGTGFTPIINPPEVAILGVGRMAISPVWQGESFEPRKMLPLSLSYDHRAINGAEAGRFMARLRDVLADIRQIIM